VDTVEDLDPTSSREVAEYLTILDDAAFGGTTSTEPKAISPIDRSGGALYGSRRRSTKSPHCRRSRPEWRVDASDAVEP